MAQTPEGALKLAANAAGISVAEFIKRRDSGLKRCWQCKDWKNLTEFSGDRHRPDGKKANCLACNRVKIKKDRRGTPSAFKGKKHTPESLAKISRAHKGKVGPRKGQKLPPEFGLKVSLALRSSPNVKRGSDHYAWKNGAAERSKNDRRKAEYREWRLAVFKRDNFTCTRCKDSRGGNLEAHHIKPFADHPELRFDIDNGITLCTPCHMAEHFKETSIRNRRKRKRGELLWK